MISDEASAAGDGAVLHHRRPRARGRRRRRRRRGRRDLRHRPRRPRGDHATSAAAGGTFADGVTLWTGSGADIDRDRRHAPARRRADADGAQHRPRQRRRDRRPRRGRGRRCFVLDTQGQAQHVLPIAGGLSCGDHHTPADVVSVTVGGVPLGAASSRSTTRSAPSSCTANPPIGAIATVTIAALRSCRPFTLGATGSVTFAGLVGAGDQAVASVNGVAATPAVVGHDADVRRRAARRARRRADRQDLRRRPSRRRTPSRATTTSSTPRTRRSPLVIFGGQGDDELHGGTGGDVIFGDRGRVLYFDPSQTVPSVGDRRARRGRARDARGVSRRPSAATAAPATRPTAWPRAERSRSASTRRSAATTSSRPAPAPRDIVIGGVDDDDDHDQPRRDRRHARRLRDRHRRQRLRRLRPASTATPADIDRIWSIDPDTGGSDDDHHRRRRRRRDRRRGRRARHRDAGAAHGSSSRSVERHLADGDVVVAGNGRNLVFGDNGRITAAVADGAGFGALPMTLGLVRRSSRSSAASDDITTGSGSDIVHRRHRRGHDHGRRRPQHRLRRQRPDRLGRGRARRRAAPATTSTRPTSTGSSRWRPTTAARTSSRPARATTSSSRARTASSSTTSRSTGHTAVARTVVADAARGNGDTVDAGDGQNLVIGDSGEITRRGEQRAPTSRSAPSRCACSRSRRSPRTAAAATRSRPATARTSCSAASATTRSPPAASLDIVLGDNGRITFLEATPATVTAGSPEARIDLDPDDRPQRRRHRRHQRRRRRGPADRRLGGRRDRRRRERRPDLRRPGVARSAGRSSSRTRASRRSTARRSTAAPTRRRRPATASAPTRAATPTSTSSTASGATTAIPDGAGDDVPDWARYLIVDLFHSRRDDVRGGAGRHRHERRAVAEVADLRRRLHRRRRGPRHDLRPARRRHDPGRRLDRGAQQRPRRCSARTACRSAPAARCPPGTLASDATGGYLVGARRVITGGVVAGPLDQPELRGRRRRRRLHRGRRRRRHDLRRPRPGRHRRRQLVAVHAHDRARSGPTAPT